MSNAEVTAIWISTVNISERRMQRTLQAEDRVQFACRAWSDVPIAESLQLLQPCRSLKQVYEAYLALQ